MKKLKILHWSNFAPNKSGLYECTKDQIKYERSLGIDSQMAVYALEDPKGFQDGWLTPVSWDWAKQADLFVIHRGIPNSVLKKYPNTKKIAILHGTSEYLLLEDVFSQAEKQGFNAHINYINNYDATTVVNAHDYDIMKLYDYKNKLSMIHDSIDIERYSSEGYKYPYKNHPQILYCDSLRVNKHPAHIIWAMDEIVKKIPNAKLTIIGLSLFDVLTWRNLLLRSAKGKLYSHCEVVQFRSDDVLPYMRGADILFNANMSGIPSRVEMEAMSTGLQVVSYNGDFSKWHPKPFDIKDIAAKVVECWSDIKDRKEESREEASQYAKENFNMKLKVQDEYIPLYNKVLKGSK